MSGQQPPPGWYRTAEDVARGADLRGRRVVLTGASSGIGTETARVLAEAGAELILGVRDVRAGEAVAEEIAIRATTAPMVLRLNLADLDSVHEFAAGISGPVDVLINNAGVSKTPDAHLANGLDVRFATNHLGHFYLAHRLLPNLSVRGARIVVLSSAAHKGMPVHLEDLQWTARPHFDGAAYAESKSANILFAQEASRRWGGRAIYANAVLPGSALTGLQRYHGEELKRRIGFIDADGTLNAMVKSTAQAAATSVWAAIAPELEAIGGWVLEDCGRALEVTAETHAWSGFDPAVADPEVAQTLWEQSLELVEQLRGERL